MYNAEISDPNSRDRGGGMDRAAQDGNQTCDSIAFNPRAPVLAYTGYRDFTDGNNMIVLLSRK